MEPNDDIVEVPASTLNISLTTDPALITVLSAIQQTMAENKNLILDLKSSQHHALVASQEAQVSASEEANTPASGGTSAPIVQQDSDTQESFVRVSSALFMTFDELLKGRENKTSVDSLAIATRLSGPVGSVISILSCLKRRDTLR